MEATTELEPLIPDSKLWPIEEKIRTEFPALPSSTRMWTANTGSEALFAIDAPHPKQETYQGLGLQLPPGKQMLLREQMTTDIRGWRDYEKERSHFAGHKQPDMEYQIFHKLANDLCDQISTLKSMLD